MNPPTVVRRTTRAAQMFDELSSRLVDGRLAPGSRLTERALGEEFRVSRTVVREAVSRLEAAGWVRSIRGVGTIVTSWKHSGEIRLLAASLRTAHGRLAEFRAGLETESAALAARRRTAEDIRSMRAALQGAQGAATSDRAFHLAVARAARNTHYARLLALVLDLPGQGPHRTSGHEDIVDAIERGDGDAASAHMRVHLAIRTDINHQRGASE